MNEEINRIFIPPDNRMTATFSLIGSNYSEVFTEINIRSVDASDKLSEIRIRALKYNLRDTEINVMYRGYSDVLTEIQPMGFDSIHSEIEVRPGNRMWALYEVQEPPKLLSIQNPIKDTFARDLGESRYINYGDTNTLVVGNKNGEHYESFVYFNLSNWHPQHMVIDSSIRVYYSGSIPNGISLELISIESDWSEYGLTYMNKPEYSILIGDQYEVNEEQNYIEFKVTDQVKAWINRPDLNKGFVIKSVNEVSGTINFRSRESSKPPELLITYYDARILSTGRSQIYAEIFIWSVGSSEVLTEIEVNSVYGNSNVPTEIYVHRAEVPVESDIDTEIIVTRLKNNSEITISLQDRSEILTVIDARSDVVSNRVSSDIVISKPYQFADVFVKYKDTIDSEITIAKIESDNVFTEISVSRNFIFSELHVKHQDFINAEIIVQHKNNEETIAEITVSRDKADTEIYVKYQDHIDSEISIYGYEDSDIYAEISILRGTIDTDIYVRAVNESEISTYLNVRVKEEEVVLAEISTSRVAVLTEIVVTYYEDTETEIFVKYQHNTPSELIVTKPIIHTEIIVPQWDENIIFTEIKPRVLTINQVDAEILIRDGVNAYAYII